MSHLHEICIYIWVVYSFCLSCCLFIIVTWWYVWCIEWASGNQEKVQACLVTLWLYIISCYSLYKTNSVNQYQAIASGVFRKCCDKCMRQATGLDAWASRVKCPARFVSHLLEICIYIWVVYSLCLFCCLFITVTWWYVWCIEWASGNQEEVQACLVTLWLFIISCYSLYKTTLCLLCSWFENNPHFHKYSMDFLV